MSKFEEWDEESERVDFNPAGPASDYEAWERKYVWDRTYNVDEEKTDIFFPPISDEIDVLNKALQNYSGEDNSEEKKTLQRRLEALQAECDRMAGLDEEGRLKSQERQRLSNLENYGCESLDERLTEYRNELKKAAKLSHVQIEALSLAHQRKTQAEIAQKLKLSQQAISKALESAQEKLI